MKILQINTVYKEKSTGRTCAEVESYLTLHNHECFTAYGWGVCENPNTYCISSKIEYYLHNIFSRITGLQGYFSFYSTIRLIRYIKKLNPDIIHLRNLHGNYLNLPILFNYLRKLNKPIVLNLHDCWAFTGKCPYYTQVNCEKWKSNCYKCPQKNKYPQSYFFDFSKVMYRNKKKWFESINNLTVVGVSKWVRDEAKKSFLKKNNCTYIYNWVDQKIFRPYTECVLEKYGLDKNKFTIIGVSANWKEGTPRYDDFIKLSTMLSTDMQIIMVGRADQKIKNRNIVHIPFIKNTIELAKLYSSSDVYIHFSIEDTFGKVIAEALACGTPAIVYNSTGCAEIVDESCGYVVESRNINDVYNKILKIKTDGKLKYTYNCIDRVNKNFNYEKNCKQLLEIYEGLVNEC